MTAAAHCTCPPRWREVHYGQFRLPSAAACDVEFARYHHLDLGGLDEIDIEAELIALAGTLAALPRGAQPCARGWLLERRRHLLAVREQRGRAPAFCAGARTSQADDTATGEDDESDPDALVARALREER
jgi:hypothetical protein